MPRARRDLEFAAKMKREWPAATAAVLRTIRKTGRDIPLSCTDPNVVMQWEEEGGYVDKKGIRHGVDQGQVVLSE